MKYPVNLVQNAHQAIANDFAEQNENKQIEF